jgi:hypothetical protein
MASSSSDSCSPEAVSVSTRSSNVIALVAPSADVVDNAAKAPSMLSSVRLFAGAGLWLTNNRTSVATSTCVTCVFVSRYLLSGAAQSVH